MARAGDLALVADCEFPLTTYMISLSYALGSGATNVRCELAQYARRKPLAPMAFEI
jgi:hypothetical protein